MNKTYCAVCKSNLGPIPVEESFCSENFDETFGFISNKIRTLLSAKIIEVDGEKEKTILQFQMEDEDENNI
jgi:predicted nucleic acid-binding Zn ribbon protein